MDDERSIETQITSKASIGPRITPADIEANIASEYYFTAAEGVGEVSEEMVTRFLQWRLPDDFSPDAGISFKPEFNVEWNAQQGRPPQRHEPVGTNLLSASQARAMLEHVLQPGPSAPALSLLTFCVLVLRNGFTVTGESACASPENFDAAIGRRIARQNAVNKIWPLLGYELRTKLSAG